MDRHVEELGEQEEEEAKEGREVEQFRTVLCGLGVVGATTADIDVGSVLTPSSGAEVYATGGH